MTRRVRAFPLGWNAPKSFFQDALNSPQEPNGALKKLMEHSRPVRNTQHSSDMVEASGWLIEQRPHPEHILWATLCHEPVNRHDWHTVRHGDAPVIFVKDASHALRFARKQDAEAFVKVFDRFLLNPIVTEHSWPTLEASHHAELVNERNALAKRVHDLEGDCDSYAKTLAVINERANAEASKLVHHAELAEALRECRLALAHHAPATPPILAALARTKALLAKIGDRT